MLLAAAGAALLLGNSYELSRLHFTGDLLALLAGLFYTFYLIAVDRARQSMKPFPVLFVATAAGALPILFVSLAIGEQVVPGDWTPVIALSISSQLIGQGLLVYAMGHLSPVIVGLCFLTQPIASAAIGWAAYGETPVGERRDRRSADLHRPGADPGAGAKTCNRGRPGSLSGS